MTKDNILAELKRTTDENNGKPLGVKRFRQATGISPYDWQKYWVRFGDLIREAGYEPNTMQVGYSDEFSLDSYAKLIQELGHIPVQIELRIQKNKDPQFPGKSAFDRLGGKMELLSKVIEHCRLKGGYSDVIEICKPILEKHDEKEEPYNSLSQEMLGEVYLFKSGRHYKIGKTKDTVRRGNELRIQLPERLNLIHSIKTDDPTGVELYWHRRFSAKNMNGEWFDLNPSDVKAFKRWRRIY